jgi:hypothetical protein
MVTFSFLIIILRITYFSLEYQPYIVLTLQDVYLDNLTVPMWDSRLFNHSLTASHLPQQVDLAEIVLKIFSSRLYVNFSFSIEVRIVPGTN